MTDSYHTQMIAPEQSPHASTAPLTLRDGCQQASAPSGELPITEQEEEAWLDKLRDLAGMTT